MIPRRRFVIQLTPLLDLLLILVFALLLGLRQQGRTEENRSRNLVTKAVPDLAAAKDPVASVIERLNEKAADLENAQEDLTVSKQHQKKISDLVKELFKIPPEALNELLRIPPEDKERLKNELTKLAEMTRSEVVQHLVDSLQEQRTFDEIRKRFDLWDLVIGENHRYELKAGEETKSFQAKTPDEFEDKLFRAYQELAQPKDLVILMWAWKPDADFDAQEIVLMRINKVVDRMEEDRGGQTQFYPVKLGLQGAADNR